MLIQIILLIVGFIILIRGADIFVDGSSNLARNFKLSKMLIGLTIVAFGTSAPEFAVSIKATLSGSGEIVLGNVVGSNILNILLILGCSSLIHDLKVKNNTVKKEIPITLLITTLLAVLMSDSLFNNQTNILTRGDGICLILFFLVFIYYLTTIAKRTKQEIKEDEELLKKEKIYSIPKSIIYTVGGLVAIIIGSNFVVDSATYIAEGIGISERVIGLTIIALGTSLPELVTSIVATKKGEYDIAIGNIVGSNIFNIGIVLGLPIAVFGNITVGAFSDIDLIFLLLSAFVLFLFSINDYKLKKNEGIIFLVIYAIYNILLLT